MKTNVLEREIETNSNGASEFTIKASGKAFRVLIDSLYADKIQSVTREIWSNALDSHIMAGKEDVPFDVYFPSIFEPTFKVRDYGVGLTHEQVVGLYTTLFESTKEDTNTQVGKFGIGSKSPFAYTDTFSVTAIKNGHKNFYSAVLNGDGIPSIHHLHHEIVDEENGVEVSFPVRKDDLNSFQKASKRVALGFDVKPNVINIDDFEWNSDINEILVDGIYAKMGCVIYPVDVNIVYDEISKPEQKYKVSQGFVGNLLGTKTVIEVPVGSMEISASRESLSYGRNDPTKETLMKALEELEINIKANLCKTIDSFKTIRHAHLFLKGHFNDMVIMESLFGDMYSDIFKDGAELSSANYWSYIFCNDYREYSYYRTTQNNQPGTATYNGVPVVNSTMVIDVDKPRMNDIKYVHIENGTKKINTMPMSGIVMSETKKFLFVLNDNVKGNEGLSTYQANKKRIEITKKLRHIQHQFNKDNNNRSHVYYIEIQNDITSAVHFLERLYEDYVEGIDFEIVNVDDIEVPVAPKVSRTIAKKSDWEKVKDVKLRVACINTRDDGEQIVSAAQANIHQSPDDTHYFHDKLVSNPDLEYILIEASSQKPNVILNHKKSGYDANDFGFVHREIMLHTGLPMIIVPPSKCKVVMNYLKNYTKIEDMDLTYLAERAIDIKRRDHVQVSDSHFDIKYEFRNVSGKHYISQYIYLPDNSVFYQYEKLILSLTKPIQDQVTGKELSFLKDFGKTFRNGKLMETYDEAVSSLGPDGKTTIQMQIKDMEATIKECYPMMAFTNKCRYSADDLITFGVYIKKIDDERNKV